METIIIIKWEVIFAGSWTMLSMLYTLSHLIFTVFLWYKIYLIPI